MPDPTTIASFLVAVLAMRIASGPDTAPIVSRGTGQGTPVALCRALGAAAATGLDQVPMLALGVASVVQASPLAFDMIRHMGATYLIYFRGPAGDPPASAGRERERVEVSRTSADAAVRQGMIVNLTTPSPTMFMPAFLPQFVDPENGPVAVQMLIRGTLRKFSGFPNLGSTALASGTVGEWFARRSGLIV